MNVIATRYDYYIEIETEMKHAAIFFLSWSAYPSGAPEFTPYF